jgi:hypothetical protein
MSEETGTHDGLGMWCVVLGLLLCLFRFRGGCMRYGYQAMVGAGGAMMRYRTREVVYSWMLKSVLCTVSNGEGRDGRRLENADRAKITHGTEEQKDRPPNEDVYDFWESNVSRFP